MALLMNKKEKCLVSMKNTPTKTFILLITIGIGVALAPTTSGQHQNIVREYTEAEESARFNSLFDEFGKNKTLPAGFELQTLLALSHYPELKETRIRFIVDDVSIPLSSRPHWSSMLRSAHNRTYLVIMDSNMEGPRDVLLVKNQPFNAQIGIIGHELAHTVYYLERSLFGIAADAICQFTDCRINFERATDRRLIDYGLGWQRFDHAAFVRRRSTENRQTVSSTEGGGGAYMSPAEILSIMEEIPVYSD